MQLKTFLTYHQSPSHFSLAVGSNGELAILDTLLKDSNGYISVLNDNQYFRKKLSQMILNQLNRKIDISNFLKNNKKYVRSSEASLRTDFCLFLT